MNKRALKYFFNIVLIIVLAILVMYIALKDNYEQVIPLIRSANAFYLGICALIAIFYHVIVGAILKVFARIYRSGYKLKEGVQNAFIAALFHGITPFASGGQFIQGYVFYKQGINVGESASILLMDFIVYQTTLVVYTLALIIMRYTHFFKVHSSLFSLAFIGFLINFLVIVGLWLLAKSNRFHKFITTTGIKVSAKLRIVKKPEETIIKINEYLDKFNTEISILSNHRNLLIKVVLMNILRLSVYYSMPFLICLALNVKLDGPLILDMIALAAFVSLINAFVPLPGASGGAEGSYTIMFSAVLAPSVVISSMILWRFLTYYMILIIGVFVFALFKNKHSLRKIEEELYENRTI